MKIRKFSRFDRLFQLAKFVRDDLIGRHCPAGEEQCLRALCHEASLALCSVLIGNGFPAVVVEGTFRTDLPDFFFDAYDEDPYDPESSSRNPLHYWVEVEGIVVDITADQFNTELDGEEIPAVVVGFRSDLPRYSMS